MGEFFQRIPESIAIFGRIRNLDAVAFERVRGDGGRE
jgi:hypothetical protein